MALVVIVAILMIPQFPGSQLELKRPFEREVKLHVPMSPAAMIYNSLGRGINETFKTQA